MQSMSSWQILQVGLCHAKWLWARIFLSGRNISSKTMSSRNLQQSFKSFQSFWMQYVLTRWHPISYKYEWLWLFLNFNTSIMVSWSKHFLKLFSLHRAFLIFQECTVKALEIFLLLENVIKASFVLALQIHQHLWILRTTPVILAEHVPSQHSALKDL